LSRVKSLDGPRVRGISPVRKEKVCGGIEIEGFVEKPSLEFRVKYYMIPPQ